MDTRIDSLLRFCGTYCQQRLSLSHGGAEQLAVAVRQYSKWLGREATLGDLQQVPVLGFLRAQMGLLAPATINSKRQALLSLWRAAAEEGLLAWPPKIPKLREPERLPVAWTLDQVSRLLQTARALPGIWYGVPRGLAWEICLLLIWDTGVRVGSVLAAEVSQVDLAAGLWRVPAEHQKGRRRDRLFRLHPQTIDAIARSLGNGRTTTRLFPFPYRRREVWLHLKCLLRDAGLPFDRTHLFHCLRRTTESYGAAARGIEWAAACVGHSPAVARKSYISPLIFQPPSLVEVVPRPTFG
jgi:integrase